MNKAKKIVPWLPLVLLGVSLIGAGGAKLAGVPELHASFSAMGLPVWFGYFIGLAELLAGGAMFVPRLTALSGLCLIPIMIGAAYYHIAYGVPSAIPSFVFLALALYAIVLRKKEAIWFPF
ncbi:DoxX family protein [Vibrio pelagius]|uniref:DoxX family protein n=1 Tax=Vibrio pelagius TaxID=28169 RepID=UPI003551079C